MPHFTHPLGVYSAVEFSCGSQGSADAAMLRLYRALYRGERQPTIDAVRARYMAADLGYESGYEESRRNFPVVNELRAIIDRRIDALPDSFDILHEDERLQQLAVEWASGRVQPTGRSLFAGFGQMAQDQERDGNVGLVLSKRGDAVQVAIRDTEDMAMRVDSLTGEVLEVIFRWVEKIPGQGAVQHAEILTAETHTVRVGDTESVESHGLGFLPVVIIPREEIHGMPIGVSGVADLFEAYLHFLWSHYLLNVANKYESFGVYCPDGDDDGAMIPDSATGGNQQFRISPGCLYPIPIKKVGGSIQVGSIQAQLQSAAETLYRIGKVKRDRGASGDMRSGKALLIDTHELRDYANRKLSLLRDGLLRLLDMVAWAHGWTPAGEPSGFAIEFPGLDDDDPAEQTKRAELWMKAEQAGFCRTIDAMRAWQKLGMIDGDTDVEALAAEIEAEKEAKAAEAMERFAARQPQPGQPVAEDDDEDEDEDEQGMSDG